MERSIKEIENNNQTDQRGILEKQQQIEASDKNPIEQNAGKQQERQEKEIGAGRNNMEQEKWHVVQGKKAWRNRGSNENNYDVGTHVSNRNNGSQEGEEQAKEKTNENQGNISKIGQVGGPQPHLPNR